MSNIKTPSWYPGDEAFAFLNELWVPVFGIFALVSLIVVYKIIREGWPKYLIAPFITNIIGVVLFPIVVKMDSLVLGGSFVTLLMFVGTVVQIWELSSRARTLALLCVPYLIWLIIILIISIELIRLNMF